MDPNPYESPRVTCNSPEQPAERITIRDIASGIAMVLGIYSLIISLWALLLAVSTPNPGEWLAVPLSGLALSVTALGVGYWLWNRRATLFNKY